MFACLVFQFLQRIGFCYIFTVIDVKEQKIFSILTYIKEKSKINKNCKFTQQVTEFFHGQRLFPELPIFTSLRQRDPWINVNIVSCFSHKTEKWTMFTMFTRGSGWRDVQRYKFVHWLCIEWEGWSKLEAFECSGKVTKNCTVVTLASAWLLRYIECSWNWCVVTNSTKSQQCNVEKL